MTTNSIFKPIRRSVTGVFYVLIGLAAPLIASAQGTNTGTAKPATNKVSTGVSSGNVGIPQPLGRVDAPTIIGQVLKTAIGAAGAVALLMFIYAGFKMMTAQGNSEKMNEGKKTMIWAVFGLLGVFLSYAAVRLVLSALGAA